jgi:hypothetical protein
MSGSKVSVIIPTYNRYSLLVNTILNIKAAQPYEIIIVDDGSTDNTVEKLKAQFDQELIIVTNKGKGPGAARNTGFSIATGDFIKFFDSDDVMSPGTLTIQQERLSDSSDGFLYSPYIRAHQKSDGNWVVVDPVILNYHPFDSTRQLNYWMVRGLFLAIPGMLFRRELLKEAGPWPEATTAYEDWEYLWRLALVEPRPIHTNETVFLYRQHGEQTTQNRSNDGQRDGEAVHVFEKILHENFHKYSSSQWERALMKTKVYSILKKNRDSILFKNRMGDYNFLFYDAVLFYLRIYNKINRMQTKSDWAPCYGPETSAPQINQFMSYFNQNL